jgi:hypothetical protein
MIFREIDKDGYYLRDVNLHRNIDPDRYIEQNWTVGLYRPRWSRTQKLWCEGMLAADIEKIQTVNKLKRKIARAEILARRVMAEKKDGAVWRNRLIDLKRKYKKEIKELEN